MGDAVIVWGVELTDHVSAPANAAAVAMGTAADRANTLQKALNGAQAAAAKAAALGDVAAFKKAAVNAQQFTEQLDKLKPALAQAAEAERIAALQAENMAEKHESMFAEMFKAEIAVEALKRAFDFVVDSGKELISMSIEASERVAHLSEVFGALSGASEESAGAVGKQIFDLTRSIAKELPQSEAAIQSWARSLMAAGVTDMSKLQDSLKAISGAEALVEGGGEKVRSMLAKLSEASERGTKVKFSIGQLAGTGVTESEFLKQIGMTAANFEAAKKHGQITGTAIAEALTRAIGEKAAGPLAGQMGELSTIITKAKDSAMQLLEGVNPKPLVDGIKMLLSVFDATQPSGKLLKDILTGAFDAIFVVAGKVFAFLKTAFLQLMIWSLQAAIWLKPIVREFDEWFQKVHGAQILMTALKGIGIVVGIFAVALGAVVVAAGAVALGITLATTAIIGFVAWIIGMVPKAGEALGDLAFKAVEAGKNFVKGLADGISSGAEMLINAVKNLGGIVIRAIKGILGISSPSTVMFGVGVNTAAGLEAGINEGAPKAADASARMGADAANAATSAGGSGSSSSGPSIVLHVEAGAVTISAGGQVSPARVEEMVEEGFASLANRLAAMIGSAPVPA
jgi:hypothetical protein